MMHLLTWVTHHLLGKVRPAAPAKPPAAPTPAPPAKPPTGTPTSPSAPPPPPKPAIDDRSKRNIATLHPRVQAKAKEFLTLANALAGAEGLEVRIICGLRTYQEQAQLYAKGRTAPGPVVTKARPGHSNHNFGTAWDIGLFRGKAYLPNHKLYTTIGQAARSLGIVWGGDFKSFKDTPHYEIPTGLTLAQMRQRIAAGKDIFA